MTAVETKDEEGRIVTVDGDVIRVRMMLMDSAPWSVGVDQAINASKVVQHSPGSLPVSDADRIIRDKMLETREKRLTDAWKTAPPLDPRQAATALVTLASASVLDRRDARLQNAWRSA